MGLLTRFLKTTLRPPAAAPKRTAHCPVCTAPCAPLDRVDFNKNCEEARGKKLPDSGILVEYVLCDECGFCFAPEFGEWAFGDFEEHIYNQDYEKVDPDYKLSRPQGNAEFVDQLLGSARITHLDYGGGSGLLSAWLRDKGWDSRSYDPFVQRDARISDLGTFDLVTAFEVFEHVPDIDELFANLLQLMKPDGLLLFSTMLSDGEIARGKPLTWWYAAPRNGHISLFSGKSLRTSLNRRGLQFASASANLHVAHRGVPVWARHFLPA